MSYRGDYSDNAVVNFPFTTNDGSGGAVAPSSAFEAADLVIYKGTSATQKTTTNGITMTSPFDSITGLHHVSIDTGNDTGDASFWEVGYDYFVILAPDETVDSQTVVALVAHFSIENRNKNVNFAQTLPGSPTADTVGDAMKQATREEAPKKNVALSNIPFKLVSSTDHVSGVTSATVAAQVSKDGASFAAAAGSYAEIGSGLYRFNATAADMNADSIILRFTASGADPVELALGTVA